MFPRRPVVKNEIVARQMRQFFRSLREIRPEGVAKSYGAFQWDRVNESLDNAIELSRDRYHISLSTARENFDQLTKRTALVSDTLLLCHDWTGTYHGIGESGPKGRDYISPKYTVADSNYAVAEWQTQQREHDARQGESTTVYGMHCPDLDELGRWLLGARDLLEAGLVWYLPSYSVVTHHVGERRDPYLQTYGALERAKAVDFLVRDGRAVDTSDVWPTKSHLVRPLMQVDLPFMDGLSMRDFSKVTLEEFASYSAFRDFLRRSFLEMDQSLDAVQSDQEIAKLGLRIREQVRAARAEMELVRRKRAVAVTGAVVGTVATVLVAVCGSVLAAAITALGASGGLWSYMNAAAENSTRLLCETNWHYVWVLARKSGTHVV
ncbi:hypothetical protein [Actinophytocola oryzae]|uniref:Uncharacterized protein n=1 Tax=Actinophytocola oryzae TaxID=502181 RepID=A0A4R7V5I4_9PSEU|nr:hypothetical protein [Actinophytocola oryzae]TDV43215.1 hypothetical protein CLV71_116149 [Actinophytocola oryzae]